MHLATSASTNTLRDLRLDRLLFYAFWLVSLALLVDPLYLGYGEFRVARDLGPFKYIGLFLGVIASAVAVAGMLLRGVSHLSTCRRTLAIAWPLGLLACYILVGSLIARNYFDVRETFIQLGSAVLGFPFGVIL